jgi:hypothetical protein
MILFLMLLFHPKLFLFALPNIEVFFSYNQLPH